MFRIETRVDVKSADFKKNRDHNLKLVQELKGRLEEVKKRMCSGTPNGAS
jgi:hypothetical protein